VLQCVAVRLARVFLRSPTTPTATHYNTLQHPHCNTLAPTPLALTSSCPATAHVLACVHICVHVCVVCVCVWAGVHRCYMYVYTCSFVCACHCACVMIDVCVMIDWSLLQNIFSFGGLFCHCVCRCVCNDRLVSFAEYILFWRALLSLCVSIITHTCNNRCAICHGVATISGLP